jgi:hypothetical protein
VTSVENKTNQVGVSLMKTKEVTSVENKTNQLGVSFEQKVTQSQAYVLFPYVSLQLTNRPIF